MSQARILPADIGELLGELLAIHEEQAQVVAEWQAANDRRLYRTAELIHWEAEVSARIAEITEVTR
jgi:hypothetical protein